MSRRSIIDLAGGHQPVFNEDRSILVVFNGEIYNYQELESELETRAPLLDQYLVEYVASIPSTIRTHGGELKHLLKKVAAGMLPEAIVTEQGFSPPQATPIQRLW